MQVTVKAIALGSVQRALPLVWTSETLCVFYTILETEVTTKKETAHNKEFKKSEVLTLLLPKQFQLLVKI